MAAKILFVEDEPLARNLFCQVLRNEGYRVIEAGDGTEALELLQTQHVDLVISDVRMPRMDGVALARHIVSSQPITPIFLMTAYQFDSREDISALNVPCLGKPFSFDQLLSRIRKSLGEER